MPVTDIISESKSETFTFSLDPAVNALHSFMLITMTEERSGLGEWVLNTRKAMSESEYQDHRLVMIGFFFLLSPDRQWASFDAFLTHFARRDPFEMRDDLLQMYCDIGSKKSQIIDFDQEKVLSSADNYVAFLTERFGEKFVDEDLEREAFKYTVQPEKMQALIVSHLRDMWDGYFESEWKNIRPMLMDSAEAFRQVDLAQLDQESAIALVTREDKQNPQMKKWMENVEKIIFVPSAHLGSYTGRVHNGNTMWVLFGAHIPEGVDVDAPDLSRAELVVRLSALADNDRLRIMKLLSEEGELKSQEIQERLGLSQSASSRQLKQLSATGFLSVRRCSGAKCYELYWPKIEETLDAFSLFLVTGEKELDIAQLKVS
jgi:DNA-binding transcriptional ArsR family regulator